MDREGFAAQLDMLVFQARTEGVSRRAIVGELALALARVLEEQIKAMGHNIDKPHDRPKH